jgi:hypothetical protein
MYTICNHLVIKLSTFLIYLLSDWLRWSIHYQNLHQSKLMLNQSHGRKEDDATSRYTRRASLRTGRTDQVMQFPGGAVKR